MMASVVYDVWSYVALKTLSLLEIMLFTKTLTGSIYRLGFVVLYSLCIYVVL